jgi:putative methyltransferase (TIGR04325 family)
LPLLRPLLQKIHRESFARHGHGAFLGVFSTFEEAARAAPSDKPLGFENQESANDFGERRSRIFSFDYPILFWLGPLLRSPVKLFDYGGHCGTHFYAYSRYLAYPAGLQWQVCDLPDTIKLGEQLAKQNGKPELTFTGNFEDSDGADILLAAGSLQYIEAPAFSVQLSRLKSLPRHIFINKTPIYDGPTVVTLQNGVVAYHPMYVFNRQEFLDPILALDYKIIDEWAVPSRPGRIPFHPEASFPCHSGMYLRLR